MTRTDSLVVGTLVALLALIASLVSVPSLLPTAASSLEPGATDAPIARPYREGVLGRPVSVSPLSARTQADRDLVALVYAGLVRNGPSGSLVPDLAERWTVDSTGAVWTFQLRDDARWHDGEPVTAEDVAFTIGVLQDPDYRGPGAGSWNEVTRRDRRAPHRRVHAQDPARWLPPGGDPADRPGPHPGRDPGRPARRPARSVASRSGPGRSRSRA